MSREIKFRVYDQTSKDYKVYGIGEAVDEHFGLGIISRIVWWLKGIKHKFIIEQYTGLKDKNGKEIYEGDIVNIVAIVETDDSDMACIMDTNSIVCWDKEHARWDVNDEPEDKDWDYRRRRYFVFVDNKDRENVEVIGNIHENPELLKGEENAVSAI